MTKIIVFDLMETLVSGGGIYPIIKRIGLDEFMSDHSDCLFVIATSAGSIMTKEESEQEVEFYIEQIGIKEKISKVYYGWDMLDGLKDLSKIAEDFNKALNDLVFIGDGSKDEESAKHFGVEFIKVPSIFRDIMKVRNPIDSKTYAEDYANAPNKYSFENLKI